MVEIRLKLYLKNSIIMLLKQNLIHKALIVNNQNRGNQFAILYQYKFYEIRT